MAVEYLENKIQDQGGNPARMLRPDPGGASTRAWHFLPSRNVFSRFLLRR
jgi:hypothetical protein